MGPVLDNDPQTPLPPQKEPNIRSIEHTFQKIVRRKKKYKGNFFLDVGKFRPISMKKFWVRFGQF